MAAQPKPGEGLSDQQQAGMVQIGKMLAGGDEQSGQLEDFDREVQQHLEHHPKYEAEHRKMRAAQSGEDLSEDLAPEQFEQQQVQQANVLNQQATQLGAQQAAQAQGQQLPIAAPTEPPGPVGSSQPYPAQAQKKPPQS